jgi:hypothetical protein
MFTDYLKSMSIREIRGEKNTSLKLKNQFTHNRQQHATGDDRA